jgi:hypothetical protein
MIKMARIVKSHSQSHAVDLVMMADGRRYSGVQVLASVAGGDVGSVDLPEPTVTDPNKPFESGNTGKRDMYAAVSFMGDIPMVMGFIHPQVSQTLFGDELGKNRKMYRHASDVSYTIDGQGNTELHHPSGTYIRIGTTPESEDLAGKDYDKIWEKNKNTDTKVHIALGVGNGGESKMSLSIDPDGNVTIATKGTVSIASKGDMTLASEGKMTLTAGGDFKVTAAKIDLN